MLVYLFYKLCVILMMVLSLIQADHMESTATNSSFRDLSLQPHTKQCKQLEDVLTTSIDYRCKVNIDELDGLLASLPITTKGLIISLVTQWNGNFPRPREHADFRNISHLINLRHLAIQVDQSSHRFITNLIFENNTFATLTQLEYLSVNIPLYDQDFEDIVKHLPNISTVDFSKTFGLSFGNIRKTISRLNPTAVKVLRFRQFQTIGLKVFSSVIDFTGSFKGSILHQTHEIDLSGNNLGSINPGFIQTFPNLRKINLSYNSLIEYFSDPLWWDLILHRSLEYVDVSHQSSSISHTSTTRNKQDESILLEKDPSTVRLSSEVLSILTLCININDNQNVSNIVSNTTMICHLIRCFARYAFLTDTDVVGEIPCSAYQYVTFNFSCALLVNLPLFPNLKTLIADELNYYATYSYVLKGTFCIQNSSLSDLDFSSNQELVENGYVARSLLNLTLLGFDSVRQIDFSNNGLNFELPTSNNTFQALRVLSLKDNSVILRNTSLCQFYPHMRNINLQSNAISYLYPNFFVDCYELEVLDLSHNNISSEHLNIVLNSENLKLINLSYNNLQYIPPSFAKELDKIHQLKNHERNRVKIMIDFSGNQLACDCRILSIQSINWIQETKVKIKGKDNYVCSGVQGSNILVNVKIKELNSTCFPSDLVLIVTTATGTFSFTVLCAIIGILYYFRWRIRYLIFRVQQRFKYRHRPRNDEDAEVHNLKYDAFVSYCAIDRFWVHDVLMKKLEGEYGFKLCIHYRDFPVGGLIVDAIISSIRASRQVIIVISEISLKREWCQFEMQVACSEARNRGVKVVVVKLEDIVTEAVNESIVWLLENQVYLEWSDDAAGQKLFWAKLVSELYEDPDGGYCCCRYGRKAITYREMDREPEEHTERSHLLGSTQW